MSGSEGGLEKPTHRKMDKALQPDPYEGSTRRSEADLWARCASVCDCELVNGRRYRPEGWEGR